MKASYQKIMELLEQRVSPFKESVLSHVMSTLSLFPIPVTHSLSHVGEAKRAGGIRLAFLR
jgi:hypothetical protein